MINEQVIYRTYGMIKKKLFFVMFVVGMVIMYLIIKKSGGFGNFIKVLGAIPLILLVAAMLTRVVSSIFISWRFKLLIDPDVSFWEVFKIDTVGFILNYGGPAQGVGLGSRIGMYKMKGIAIAKSGAGVTSEIIYDMIFHVLFITVYVAFKLASIQKYLTPYMSPYLLIPVGFVVAFLIVLFFNVVKIDFIKRYRQHLLKTFTLKKLFFGLVFTFISWLAVAYVGYLLFKGVGYDVDIWLLMLSSSIAFFVGLASFIPGGLGVRDGVRASIYVVAGVPFAIAGSISIGMRLLSIVVAAITYSVYKVIELLGPKDKDRQQGAQEGTERA